MSVRGWRPDLVRMASLAGHWGGWGPDCFCLILSSGQPWGGQGADEGRTAFVLPASSSSRTVLHLQWLGAFGPLQMSLKLPPKASFYSCCSINLPCTKTSQLGFLQGIKCTWYGFKLVRKCMHKWPYQIPPNSPFCLSSSKTCTNIQCVYLDENLEKYWARWPWPLSKVLSWYPFYNRMNVKEKHCQLKL